MRNWGGVIGIAISVLGGSAVVAQTNSDIDRLMPYMTALPDCVDGASDLAAAKECVGLFASACMETEEGGWSNYGMTFCTLAENQAWDELLNRDYQTAMSTARVLDAEEAETFPEYANRADSLRDAQRAWIVFRDAECGLAYAEWGAGSMRSLAHAGCQLDMTATRTLKLHFMWQEM
ncbi:lysozyme inhibitor LprI family protein [Aestuariibius sp. HNIBRBA575]|uniref:lysozyme inhibitor LprI family protein n=1 Tax=Aestuariibius sp. HNIBRBA575 TaxID=3233343 RepID=UPI0034A20A24